jgi:hypothetical protein
MILPIAERLFDVLVFDYFLRVQPSNGTSTCTSSGAYYLSTLPFFKHIFTTSTSTVLRIQRPAPLNVDRDKTKLFPL